MTSENTATEPAAASIPLVVDLDGTLTPVDTLHEAAISLFCTRPLQTLVNIPRWLSAGKAHLKREIAARHSLDPEQLPWSQPVVNLIKSAKAEGREIVLCTASDQETATLIAEHFGFFDRVMASDGQTNLSGKNKAAALVAKYGENGFDYIGNAAPDLDVWAKSRRAIVVSRSQKLISQARAVAEVEKDLPPEKAGFHVWGKQFRLHQWAKNLLLLAPLLASQQFGDALLWLKIAMAYVVFGFIASATYVMNDLFDLKADRAHDEKRHRPLAAGLIPASHAVASVFVGLSIGLFCAFLIGPSFFWAALVYLIATILYSFAIKQMVLIDCMWLAGLFTLRIVAGGAVIGAELSHWLLMFSIFLFLSLAYLKRYIELRPKTQGQLVAGRGYMAEDLPMVLALGIGAGYASTVVLSLYLFSQQAFELYGNSYALVLNVPVMIYWLSYMWNTAHRGKMSYDPVIFALRDRTSLATVALFLLVFLVGSAVPR